jgi:hypothetical protein
MVVNNELRAAGNSSSSNFAQSCILQGVWGCAFHRATVPTFAAPELAASPQQRESGGMIQHIPEQRTALLQLIAGLCFTCPDVFDVYLLPVVAILLCAASLQSWQDPGSDRGWLVHSRLALRQPSGNPNQTGVFQHHQHTGGGLGLSPALDPQQERKNFVGH